MKFTIDQIQRELQKKEPAQIDTEQLNKAKDFIKAGLDKLNLTPPNKIIREMLINFLAMTKLDYQKKGLFLIGGTGTGKTMALKIIASYRQFDFNYSDELVNKYLKLNLVAEEILGRGSKNVIIDDIGSEITINDFGMKFELIEQVIMNRHRVYLQSGYLTLFSSNLSKEEFLSRYGQRIFSRIMEMCEIVVCNGDDLRLKNKIEKGRL